MNTSQDQFTHLMAHLVARVDRALRENLEILPMGFILLSSDEVRVFVSAAEELKDGVQQVQDGMKDALKTEDGVATCIGYPDFGNRTFVAFLENHEHYVAKLTLPVSSSHPPQLEVDKSVEEDGLIVFFTDD
ncbi:hypothetical protein J7443_09890 [Tropicibacter sp. R15_0]|uniref:hypothetical protein n=1 Tax=Tropicibacter sp. R15_0 TaxID=2821101 RepID=UPI001ADD0FCE|nr:hypothetical protein [Tropicibacter sp. R15_0]MBO9465537.1 hypothetical protein [Tropicibacter sp. R15_0]